MADRPIISPWHLPTDMRPAEQAEAMSLGSKLIAGRAALELVLNALDRTHSPCTNKRWNQRDRLEYIRTVCEAAIRRIK